jgi:DNA-binding response OmpR family regulator
MLAEGDAVVAQKQHQCGGETAGDGTLPSVLIVETNSRALRSIVAAFTGAGMRVSTATTVAAAEQACCTQHFDLIVLGWIVERLFADELLELLRSRAMPRRLPPVAVLSCLTEKMTRACLRPGTPIRGVLTKPLDPQHIANWAGALLKGA